jgi:hypothetical protein
VGDDEKKKRRKRRRVEMRSGLSTKEKMAKPPDFLFALTFFTHSVGVRCRTVVYPLADDDGDAAGAVILLLLLLKDTKEDDDDVVCFYRLNTR